MSYFYPSRILLEILLVRPQSFVEFEEALKRSLIYIACGKT